MIETVYCLDEFLSKIDRGKPIHHEIEWMTLERVYSLITRIEVRLTIYGISNKGWPIQFVESEWVRDSDHELRKYFDNTRVHNVHEAFSMFINEKSKEFDKKARQLGSTPGNFSFKQLGGLT